MINILRKILQVGILSWLFLMPWGWDTWMGWKIILNIVVALNLLLSEFNEIWNNRGEGYLVSLKLFGSPKKVIKLRDFEPEFLYSLEYAIEHWSGDNNKSYYIDIIDYDDDKFITIYKNFLFVFWVKVHTEDVFLNDCSTIKKIENEVERAINRYENKLRCKVESKEKRLREKELKRGAKSKLRKWDGLIGDENEKIAHKRESRLKEILKKKEEK